MKKFLALSLVMASFSIAAFASSEESLKESYSNFPSISAEFKSSQLCQTWLADKTAKYTNRVITNASGCSSIRERDFLASGSTHGASFKKKVVGKVVLDTL